MSAAATDSVRAASDTWGQERSDENVLVSPTVRARRKPTLVYALILLAAAGAICLAQLGISILLAQGSYRIADLQNQSTELGREAQKAGEALAVKQSPQYLAEKAAELGMTSTSSATFIKLSDGSVIQTANTVESQYQSTVDASRLVVSGNLVSNSNLTSDTAQAESASPVAATQGSVAGALSNLQTLAAASTDVASSETSAEDAGDATASDTATPPMTVKESASESAENEASTGVADGGDNEATVALEANQMPAPNTR